MKPDELDFLKRWALIELLASLFVVVGMVAGNMPLLSAGCGALAAHFAQIVSLRKLRIFHAPLACALPLVSLAVDRPWFEGVAVALLIFSLIDAPQNFVILLGRVRLPH